MCSQKKPFFAKLSRATLRFIQAENIQTFPSSKAGHLPPAWQLLPPTGPSHTTSQHQVLHQPQSLLLPHLIFYSSFLIRPPTGGEKTSITHSWKLQGPLLTWSPLSTSHNPPFLLLPYEPLAFPPWIVLPGPYCPGKIKGESREMQEAERKEEEEEEKNSDGGGGVRMCPLCTLARTRSTHVWVWKFHCSFLCCTLD